MAVVFLRKMEMCAHAQAYAPQSGGGGGKQKMSYRSFSPARGGYPAVRHHHRGGLKKHSHPSHHSHLPDRGEWRSSRRSPQYQKENGASSLMSHQVAGRE